MLGFQSVSVVSKDQDRDHGKISRSSKPPVKYVSFSSRVSDWKVITRNKAPYGSKQNGR